MPNRHWDGASVEEKLEMLKDAIDDLVEQFNGLASAARDMLADQERMKRDLTDAATEAHKALRAARRSYVFPPFIEIRPLGPGGFSVANFVRSFWHGDKAP
jgi:hypothetical protein